MLPQPYQDLLEVAADAGRPLKAGQFAAVGPPAAGPGVPGQLRGRELAQDDFWFPDITLPVGCGQVRTAKQLPVLTMVSGYSW